MKILLATLVILLSACQAGKVLRGDRADNKETSPEIQDGTASTSEGSEGQEDAGANAEMDDPEFQVPMLACPVGGTSYKGFGNQSLIAGRRTEMPLEGDRYRIKPFSALDGEFRRVLGLSPLNLAIAASTFADAPARWSIETQTNAVALNTFFKLSFEVALRFTSTDPQWALAPTPESARSTCLNWQRTAWMRNPQADESNLCQSLLLNNALARKEPRLRWAYGLAAVLASSGFIAY